MQPNKSRKPAPAKTPAPFTPAQLLQFFLQVLPSHALLELPALKKLTFYDRLFTPVITLWYLLFQWLNSDHTLDAAVVDAKKGGARRLSPRLSCEFCSAATGTYSEARTRIPEPFLAQALRLQGGKVAQQSSTTLWNNLVVCLLDGTTVRLPAHGNISRTFTRHGNQYKEKAYWCLMRAVATFCCMSGAALDCAMGPTRLSEQVLGCQIILRAVGNCLFLGDSNFGVFRIVQSARQASKEVLLRLTLQRAKKLLGHPLREGDFEVTWNPTRRDQLEPGCSAEPVKGRLIVAQVHPPGFRPKMLCLFTTLADPKHYPMEEMVRLYGLRWHVELNLRYIKAQMGADCLNVKSAAMARKTWLACLLAYNLIRAAMLCAALEKGISPLTLSFSACRRRLEAWLQNFGSTAGELLDDWKTTLIELARCVLPKRNKPRPREPRAKRHVRESFPPLVGTRAQARKILENQLAKDLKS